MKKTLFILATVAALALAQPAQAMSFFYHKAPPVFVPQTNYVVETVVNTNGVSSTVTNQVVTAATVPQWTMAPAVTTGLETGKTVSAFLPPPYDAAVSVGLTAIGGILAFILKKKNGQLSTSQTILQSVITGVEAVGDVNTKLSIQSHANAAGVQPQLNPIVQTVTANGPGPIIPTPK